MSDPKPGSRGRSQRSGGPDEQLQVSFSLRVLSGTLVMGGHLGLIFILKFLDSSVVGEMSK